MEMKVLFAISVLVLLLFTNYGASLSVHQMQAASHAILPRKLMLHEQKVESVEDKKLASYEEASSGHDYSHKGEEETLKVVTMQEGSALTRVFSMDYTPMRRRRPVHNKSSPAATISP